jgi:regulator of cell morphogenesis and NO signaling
VRSVLLTESLPRNCFDTIANPIAMMTQEHDSAEILLAEIRRQSGNFTTPVGACPTIRSMTV